MRLFFSPCLLRTYFELQLLPILKSYSILVCETKFVFGPSFFGFKCDISTFCCPAFFFVSCCSLLALCCSVPSEDQAATGIPTSSLGSRADRISARALRRRAASGGTNNNGSLGETKRRRGIAISVRLCTYSSSTYPYYVGIKLVILGEISLFLYGL